MGPKVTGTWNLHEALVDQPLDFFWMASSTVSVADEPGQANYSAACVFLEAFCQYRYSLGLPATALNICPVDGVGYLAKNARARRNIKAQGIYSLGEQEFLDFVRLNPLQAGARGSSLYPGPDGTLVSTTPWDNPSQVIMAFRSGSELHLDDPDNRTNWRRDRRMGAYHNVRHEAGNKPLAPDADPLALFLDRVLAAAAEQDGNAAVKAVLANPVNVAFLGREMGKKIYELILKPVDKSDEIDVRFTLAHMGLDSLMAIEFRRWLRRGLWHRHQCAGDHGRCVAGSAGWSRGG
jgi:hypothetical protein